MIGDTVEYKGNNSRSLSDWGLVLSASTLANGKRSSIRQRCPLDVVVSRQAGLTILSKA